MSYTHSHDGEPCVDGGQNCGLPRDKPPRLMTEAADGITMSPEIRALLRELPDRSRIVPLGPQAHPIYVPSNRSEFRRELTALLNRHSIENDANIPDHILADYIINALAVLHAATASREDWYGVHLAPGRHWTEEQQTPRRGEKGQA
jgi:hypothetical protein